MISINKRLLLAMGLVLIVVWLGAAVFTKLQAFAESRRFISEMAATDAKMVLAFVENQSSFKRPPILSRERTVAYWRDGNLIWQANANSGFQFAELRNSDLDTVQRFGEHNWVLSKRCSQGNCVGVAIRDTERKFAIRRLVASIFLPLLLIFAATLAMTYLAIRVGLRPLDRFTNDVNGLDLDKLEELPPHRQPNELLPLAEAIDILTGRMREQLDRERMFLDASAHELRTPVTGLVSQVQTLLKLDNGALTEAQKVQLNHIENSARRTGRIADQFLGLARTNNSFSGGQGIQHFNMCEVVRLVLSEFAERLPDVDLELDAPEEIEVRGDPFALELIVQNLIDNAVKHSGLKQGLRVRVKCENTPEGPAMSVSDNGCGIAQENRGSLTERFFRLDSAHESKSLSQIGTGLGLSIVSEIVSKWGGQVTFENPEKEVGFLVHVSLPIRG